MRTLARLNKLERQMDEAGIKEFSSLLDALADAVISALEKNIVDYTISNRIRESANKRLCYNLREHQGKTIAVGLRFLRTTRQDITELAEYMTSLMIEVSREHIADTAVVEQIGQDISRQFQGIIDAVRPLDTDKRHGAPQ